MAMLGRGASASESTEAGGDYKRLDDHHATPTHAAPEKETLGFKLGARGFRKVCIIGGGVAGVVTARIFLDEGATVTIMECTSELGGVWSENYSGYGLQVPACLYEFPDEPLPEGSDYCVGGVIAKYIRQYAQKHGVSHHVKFKTRVTSLERADKEGTSLWFDKKKRVQYRVGYEDEHGGGCDVFDLVIVATGVYGKQDKFIPAFKGADQFQGKIVHSSDYLDTGIAKGKDVITVGYGKSAFDCAQESSQCAKTSTLLFRKAHWCVPRKILHLVPFEYATFNRFGAACLLPGYPRAGPFEKLLHAIPYFLVMFWKLVEVIFLWQDWVPSSCTPHDGFIADYWGGHGIIPSPQFFSLVRAGHIDAKRGEIVQMNADTVVLNTGEEVPCQVLIAATGYEPKRSFLPKAVKDAREQDGLWLYRQMLHPDHPNIVFLGSGVTTFTNITTPSIQARWLVELLAGNHALPDADSMRASIKEMQDWKRSTMPNAGVSRSCLIQTHQVHYYDQLLKDMGASCRRKQGNVCTKAIKEIFDPYRPRDYNTIVDGRFKHLLGEKVAPGARQPAFYRECALFFGSVYVAVKAVTIFYTGLVVHYGLDWVMV